MDSLGSLGNTNLSHRQASWKMCVCQDLRLSLFCACSYLTRPRRIWWCQSSLPASWDARAVWSWEPTDSVVSVFRALGFFLPMPMCFRVLDKSVVKQKWGISSKHPCSEPNLKTAVKPKSFAFSSLFTRLPGALLLSQRLMDGTGSRPAQILYVHFYSFAVLILIK